MTLLNCKDMYRLFFSIMIYVTANFIFGHKVFETLIFQLSSSKNIKFFLLNELKAPFF